MHVRRIVKAGQSSYTVSLPKDWIDKNKLKKGDAVYINSKSDKELVISLEQSSQVLTNNKETIINVDKKSIPSIQREITSAYVNGNNAIILSGDELASKAGDVRKLIHDFVALEVTEQTSKRVTAHNLLDLKEVSVDKTLRRIDMIIRSMFQDVPNAFSNPALRSNISFMDHDVNRLYFLLFRITKMGLKDHLIVNELNLSYHGLFESWNLCLNLENLSDIINNVCSFNVKPSSDFKKVVSSLESCYLDAMKAYYNKDKALADVVASRRIDVLKIIDCLSKDFVEPLKSALTAITNIARITIDSE